MYAHDRSFSSLNQNIETCASEDNDMLNYPYISVTIEPRVKFCEMSLVVLEIIFFGTLPASVMSSMKGFYTKW